MSFNTITTRWLHGRYLAMVAFALSAACLWSSWAAADPVNTGDYTKKYAVVIGIDKYQDSGIRSLKAACADAHAMSRVLKALGYETVELTSDGTGLSLPTASNIRSTIASLKEKVRPGDIVFIMHSGHGMEINGQSCLLAWDTDSRDENLEGTSVRVAQVNDIIGKLPARAVMMVYDMCRTNPLEPKKITGKEAGRDSSKDAFNGMSEDAQRNFVVRPAKNTESSPEMIFNVFSCSPDQQSYEDLANKRGLFTKSFESGLQGAARNGDRGISVNDLMNYVKVQVPSAASNLHYGPQVPYVKVEGTGGTDFELVPPLKIDIRKAIVRITSDPAGASIYKGGIDTGFKTNIDLPVTVFEKTPTLFKVVAPGYRSDPEQQIIELEGGQRYNVAFNLIPDDCAIVILPPFLANAKVTVDGVLQELSGNVRFLQFKRERLIPGRSIKIRLESPDPHMQPIEREFVLAVGDVKKIDAQRFNPWPPAIVKVTTNPPGAPVTVAGDRPNASGLVFINDMIGPKKSVLIHAEAPRGYKLVADKLVDVIGSDEVNDCKITFTPKAEARLTVSSGQLRIRMRVSKVGSDGQPVVVEKDTPFNYSVPAAEFPTTLTIEAVEAKYRKKKPLRVSIDELPTDPAPRPVNIDFGSTATLTLKSNPPGAGVVIDGKPVAGALTPCDLDVPVPKDGKKVIVELSLPDFETARFETDLLQRGVSAEPDEVKLKYNGPTLTVITTPRGATVQIDGKTLEDTATPIMGIMMPLGKELQKTVNVAVSLAGYKPQAKDIILIRGKVPPVLNFTLAPLPKLQFMVDPPNARVVIKGKKTFEARADEVQAGLYSWQMPDNANETNVNVEFKAEGFAPQTLNIGDVSTESADAKQVTLEPLPAKVKVISIPGGATITVGSAKPIERVTENTFDIPGLRKPVKIIVSARFPNKPDQKQEVELGPGREGGPLIFKWTSKATLKINTTSPGGAISINGIDKGTTAPGSIELDPGETAKVYKVLVQWNKYQQVTQDVTVKPADLVEIVVEKPAAKPGVLNITSEPAGATVWVNGAKIGVTPLQNQPVSLNPDNLGKVQIRGVLDGYPELEASVDLEPGATRTVPLAFKQRTGILKLATDQTGVNITVDGGQLMPLDNQRGRQVTVSLGASGAKVVKIHATKENYDPLDLDATALDGRTVTQLIELTSSATLDVKTSPVGATVRVIGTDKTDTAPCIIRVPLGARDANDIGLEITFRNGHKKIRDLRGVKANQQGLEVLVRDEQTLQEWQGPDGGQVLAISPDGRFAATRQNNTTLNVYQVGNTQPVKTLTLQDAEVSAAAFSPDGNQLLVAGTRYATAVRTGKIMVGQLTVVIKAVDVPVRLDSVVYVWDTRVWSSREAAFSPLAGARVKAIAISSDGALFLSCASYQNRSLTMEDLMARQRTNSNFVFTPNQAVTTDYTWVGEPINDFVWRQNSVQTWAGLNEKKRLSEDKLPGKASDSGALSWTPDGKDATYFQAGSLMSTNPLRRGLDIGTDVVATALAFSQDGSQLAYAVQPRTGGPGALHLVTADGASGKIIDKILPADVKGRITALCVGEERILYSVSDSE